MPTPKRDFLPGDKGFYSVHLRINRVTIDGLDALAKKYGMRRTPYGQMLFARAIQAELARFVPSEDIRPDVTPDKDSENIA